MKDFKKIIFPVCDGSYFFETDGTTSACLQLVELATAEDSYFEAAELKCSELEGHVARLDSAEKQTLAEAVIDAAG